MPSINEADLCEMSFRSTVHEHSSAIIDHLEKFSGSPPSSSLPMCDVHIGPIDTIHTWPPPSRHEAAKPSKTRCNIGPLPQCLFLPAKTRFFRRPATIDIFTLACVKVTNLLSGAGKTICQCRPAPSTKAIDFSTNGDFQAGDRIRSLHVYSLVLVSSHCRTRIQQKCFAFPHSYCRYTIAANRSAFATRTLLGIDARNGIYGIFPSH